MRVARLAPLLLLAAALGCEALLGDTTTARGTPTPLPPELALDEAASSFAVDRPSGIVADGNDAAHLQATLRLANRAPAVGALVTVTASGRGNILQQASSTSGVDGVAHVRLASTVAETKHVTFTVHVAGKDIVLAADQAVLFVPGPPTQLGFVAPPGPATAGGKFSPAVQVAVQDAHGNACPDASAGIDLSLQVGGTLRGATHQDASAGVATFGAACAPAPTVRAVLTASAPGYAAAVSPPFVVGVGTPSSFVSDTNTVAADGFDVAHLTLTLLDATGAPLPQVAVTLQSTGSVTRMDPSGPATDANGVITITAASSRVHSAPVVASFAGGSLSVPLNFIVPPAQVADANRSTFTANPNSAQADGTAAIALTVTVLDTGGRPIAGQVVALAATGQGSAFHPAQTGTTTASGTFATSLVSTRAGNANVTATTGALTLTRAVQFTPAVCSGTLQFETGAASAAAGSFAIASADFDGDGHADVAVVNYYAGSLSVLAGAGDGTLGAPATTPVDTYLGSVVAGDLDGDGRPDLVVSSQSEGRINVLHNAGAGAFAAPQRVTTAAGPLGLLLVDLDRDGHLDVVVAIGGTGGGLDVLRGDGTGALAAPVSYASGASPYTVCSCDFDGDGWPDLAAANYAAHSVSTLANRGDGTLAAAVQHAVVQAPRWAGCGDFDGDGHVDVVVAANNEGTDVTGAIGVLLGTGSGSFAAPLTDAVTGTPYGGVVADFNHDGRLDVMVAARAANTALLLLGAGNGHFAAPASYAVGNAPTAAVAVDLDADGRLDAVLPNSSGQGGVGILLSRGCVAGH